MDTLNCKIPDIDPLNSDVWPYYKKQEYVNCRTKDLLTYIDKIEANFFLKIDYTLLDVYSPYPITCCYSNVSRGNDDEIR